MLRIAIIEDDIDALIKVIRNLLALDPTRYQFELIPTLLSDPNIDTPEAIAGRVMEYGLEGLESETRQWPTIVQKGLLCPVDPRQRGEILDYLAQQNVDIIISDSWLGKGSPLESKFEEKALKLAGLMLLDDAEKVERWSGKCWLMTMYQGDVFEQLQQLLADEGWVPTKFNIIARFLMKDRILNAAAGTCYLQLERIIDECQTLASLAEPPIFAAPERGGFGSIIGCSAPMLKLYDRIVKVAPANVPIVIQGESGVGKELVAKEIHHHSLRKDGPFIAIDCGAIPTELMESELFGHVKGSFTGALNDKLGLFEEAKSGTIFFDEIGNLPLLMQNKLMRALQEGQIKRVGSNKTIPFDARVLAATNKNLAKEVEEKRFQGDLLQRMSVIVLNVPPLKERVEDIAALCDHFLVKHVDPAVSQVKRISEDALEVLAGHTWPWNVRELENVIRRAIVEAGTATEIDMANDAIREIAEANASAHYCED
ncbi:MAG TPA: sigma-54 dependent transcriptional regulator, partial [Pyrinomonadaceae bacterium]|nr:sigma-54 dependent transcriptional regulator [Pyrinomonadaceae bacterium]